MYVECFLCFSKESKTNFPKQFITDLSVVLKRYFILSVSLHNWISCYNFVKFSEKIVMNLSI